MIFWMGCKLRKMIIMYVICQNKIFLVRKRALSTLIVKSNLSLKSEQTKNFAWYILKNKNKTQSTHKGYKLSILLFFRDIRPLNMHSPKTNSWKETPYTRAKVVSVHWMWTERTVIIFIRQSYTEKIFFHKSKAQNFIMHQTIECIHFQ